MRKESIERILTGEIRDWKGTLRKKGGKRKYVEGRGGKEERARILTREGRKRKDIVGRKEEKERILTRERRERKTFDERSKGKGRIWKREKKLT